MQGADEYAKLFDYGEQHGRLYLMPGSHARGATFHIWILPTADPVSPLSGPAPGSVEVYGIVSGQPGWTESYGWLHNGKWQQDFAALVEERRAVVAARDQQRAKERDAKEKAEHERVAAMLASY